MKRITRLFFVCLLTAAFAAAFAACGKTGTSEHVHDWGDAVYEWNADRTECTATRICRLDQSHIERTRTKDIVSEEIAPATCEEKGEVAYTATFKKDWAGTERKIYSTDALGHDWQDTVYEWEEKGDGWICTARRTCRRDPSHTESDQGVIKSKPETQPSCEGTGRTIYTAAFRKSWAEKQTRTMETPALGHDWRDPVYEWNADHTACTATRTCGRDATHTETAAAEISVEVTATCTAAGETVYTAVFAEDWAETRTERVETAALGHDWNPEIVYEWKENHTVCTATRTCGRDANHRSVVRASDIKIEYSDGICTGPGQITYTATFDKSIYEWAETQTEVVETGALGHDFDPDTSICRRCGEKLGIDGLEFKITGSTCIVKGWTTPADFSGELNIPRKHEEGGKSYSVTAVGREAFKNKTGLRKVTFSDEMNEIGESAFEGCSNLEDVTLPSRLQYLGENAFAGTKWYEVQPDGVVSMNGWILGYKGDVPAELEVGGPGEGKIADGAFRNRTGLTSLAVGDGAVYIGNAAFAGCTSLTEIDIPASVTKVEESAFEGCPAEIARIPAGAIKSITTKTSLRTLEINGGTEIPAESFSGCKTLKSVVLPDTLTKIGANAFAGCTSLTEIGIPASVTDIGAHAFRNCGSVTLLCETASKPEGWVENWNSSVSGSTCPVVWNCDGNDVAEDGFIYVMQHGLRYALKDDVATVAAQPGDITVAEILPELTHKAYRYTVKEVAERAFKDCAKLERVSVPGSVVRIGKRAFEGCSGLNCTETDDLEKWCALTFEDEWSNPVRASETLKLNGEAITDLEIPEGVAAVRNHAFRGCDLVSVTVPVTATSIGTGAFAGCTSLRKIAVPVSVTEIGADAFRDCPVETASIPAGAITSIATKTSLRTLEINGGEEIGSESFAGCAELMEVSLASGLRKVGSGAFRDCASLISLNVPATVTTVGEYAFSGCFSLTVRCEAESRPSSGWDNNWNSSGCPVVWNCDDNDVAEDGFIYVTEDGLRYALKDAEATVVRQPANLKGGRVIPQTITYKDTSYSVVRIGAHAFEGCSALAGIEVPSSVKSVGADAFKGCAPAKVVADVAAWCGTDFFNENSNPLRSRGQLYTAGSGEPVRNLTIPDGVEKIGPRAFCGCTCLASVEITSGVTAIGTDAFKGCANLSEITAENNNIRSIGDRAFEGTAWLNAQPDGVVYLNDLVTGCKGTIPADVALRDDTRVIADHAFESCGGKLKGITIPDGVKHIGEGAFRNCKGLKEITIPAGIETVGNFAFEGCGVTKLTVPADFIGSVPAASVTEIVVNGGTEIKAGAFKSFKKLESVTIPADIQTVAEDAFAGLTTLKNATIPVSAIDKMPTTGEGEDRKVTLTGIVLNDITGTEIPANAFAGYGNLLSVTVPASITGIGENAFAGCVKLQTVVVKDLAAWCGIDFANAKANPLSCANVSLCIGGVANTVTRLDIPDTVTEIKAHAFRDCAGITGVLIPGSVKTVGADAFAGCTGIAKVYVDTEDWIANWCGISFGNTYSNPLWKTGNLYMLAKGEPGETGSSETETLVTNLSVPDTVSAIKPLAFYNAVCLTSAEFAAVRTIGENAFSGCKNLTAVTVPAGVTEIGTDAFLNCAALKKVVMSSADGIAAWCGTTFGNAQANPLFYAKKLLQKGADDTETEVVSLTPDNLSEVTGINANAFVNCTCLESVELPDDVTSVGASAFSGCTSLNTLTVGRGIAATESIAADAFTGCTSLVTASIPFCAIDRMPRTVRNNVEKATLTKLTITDTAPITITADDFENYVNLTDITIPYNAEVNAGAFSGLTALKRATVPVSAIGEMPATGEGANRRVTLTEIVLNDAETETGVSIPADAFAGYGNLLSITVPASITGIGENAFADCVKLQTVVVKDLAAWCRLQFKDEKSHPMWTAKKLMVDDVEAIDLAIPEDVTVINDYVFRNCAQLNSVTIPDAVTGIGKSAFEGCTGLETVYAGNGIKTVGTDAFKGCSATVLKYIILTDAATGLERWCGIEFGNADANPLHCKAAELYIGEAGESNRITGLEIPSGVTKIGTYAFCDGTQFTSVTVPASVTEIGTGAFDGCTALTKVVIPSADGIAAWCATKFGNAQANPLFYARNLYLKKENVDVRQEILQVPDSVTAISDFAFYNCACLKTVSIPVTVQTIGRDSFTGCAVETVSLPVWLIQYDGDTPGKYIPQGSLKKVSINVREGEDTAIPEGAFSGCKNLETLVMPEGVTSVGSSAFDGCNKLKEITVPSTVASIGADAFKGNGVNGGKVNVSNLVKWCGIDFGNADANPLGRIGNLCIGGIPQTTITVPSEISFIKKYAFYKCAVTSIRIQRSVARIGADAFRECKGLRKVDIDNLEAWCNAELENEFSNPMRALESGGTLTAPGITSANDQTALVFPAGFKKIGNYTFVFGPSGYKLDTLIIPSSVTYVGPHAFDGCRITTASLPTIAMKSIPVYDSNDPLEDVTIVVPASGIRADAFKIPAEAFRNHKNLKRIIIPEGITEIGQYAFYGCENLGMKWNAKRKKWEHGGVVKIPSSVTVIAEGTFQNCGKELSRVEFPNVTHIGKSAFSGCAVLGGEWDKDKNEWKPGDPVTIPSAVTYIGEDAFRGCALMKIDTAGFPEDAEYIGSSAFDNTNWLKETVPDNSLAHIGGWALQFKGTMPENHELKFGNNEGEIPGIHHIAPSAFTNQGNLITVTMSEVRTIGDQAFEGCANLSSVTFSSSLVSIGKNAFNGCTNSGFGNTAPDGVWYLDPWVIGTKGTVSDTVTLKDGTVGIADGAFAGCSGIKNINLPNSTKYIGKEAFSGCGSLETVTVKSGLISVGTDAFRGCDALNRVNAESMEGWCGVDFGNGQANPLWRAGDLYVNGSLITNLTLSGTDIAGGTKKEIKPYVFYGCTSITSLTINSGVTKIGLGAFANCASLETLILPDTLDEISAVRLTDRIDDMGANAFAGCTSIKTATIPASAIRAIPKGALENITINSGDGIPGSRTVKGDFVSDEDKGKIPGCSVTEEGTRIPGAFEGCSSLAGVTLPNSLRAIGADAFNGCTSLNLGDSFIPDTVTSVGKDAFRNAAAEWHGGLGDGPVCLDGWILGYKGTCPATVDITGKNPKGLADYAFEGLTDMTAVVLEPEGAPYTTFHIGAGAFAGCTGLTSVRIPKNATEIRDSAFRGCTGLQTVEGWNQTGIIGESAFEGCSALKEISLPSAVKEIKGHAFYNCTGLETVNVPAQIEDVVADAFTGCTGIKTVTAPAVALKAIPTQALVTVKIRPGIESIAENRKIPAGAFDSAGNLETVIFDGTGFIDSIEDNAFKDCVSLKNITIPDSVTSIGANAFKGCAALTEIAIPESVTSIGANAFAGCKALTAVEIPAAVSAIEAGTFSGCASLEKLVVPAGLTSGSVAEDAFAGCTKIAEASLPVGVICRIPKNSLVKVTIVVSEGDTDVAIPDDAFNGCGTLSVVEMDKVTKIGARAFEDCASLTEITIRDYIEYVSAPDPLPDPAPELFVKNEDGTYSPAPDPLPDPAPELFVEKTLVTVGEYAFRGCWSLTVKCAGLEPGSGEEPAGWAPEWRYLDDAGTSKCPVVWNCDDPSSVTADDGFVYAVVNGVRYALKDIDGEGNVTSRIARVVRQPAGLSGNEAGFGIPEKVTHGDGSYTVTGIDENAFADTAWYQRQPDGLVYLGKWVLGYKSPGVEPSVKTIELPADIVGIADGAFRGCAWLDKVAEAGQDKLPTTLKYIGAHAFSGCTSLTDIEIGMSAVSVGGYAFEGCGALTVRCLAESVPADWSAAWRNLDNTGAAVCPVVWNCDTSETADDDAVYAVVNGVRYALRHDTDTEGNVVRTARVVKQPSNLPNPQIGKNVTYNGYPYDIVGIDAGAFDGTKWLLGRAAGLAQTGGWVICWIGEMTDNTSIDGRTPGTTGIDPGTTGIADAALKNQDKITTLVIPASVKIFGEGWIDGCTGIKIAVIPADVINTIPKNSLEKVTVTKGGTGVTTIPAGTEAFKGCTTLSTVIVSEGIKDIGASAFEGCTALTTVMLPGDLNSVGASAFSGCGSLEKIDLGNAGVAGDSAFAGCVSLKEIVIGNVNINIGTNVFDGCAAVGKAYVPAKVIEHIDKTSLVTVTISGAPGSEITEGAFAGCVNLETVTVLQGIKTIGKSAFSGCAKLKSVAIADETALPASLTDIGESAFEGCAALTALDVPASVKTIGASAFKNCKYLAGIVIPDNVTAIAANTFEGCVSFTGITIGDKVATVDANAFYGCTALTVSCAAPSAPTSGWAENWNLLKTVGTQNEYVPVIWSCGTNDATEDGLVYVVEGGVRYELRDIKDGEGIVTSRIARVVKQPAGLSGNEDGFGIPEKVTHGGLDYVVTSMAEGAFVGTRWYEAQHPGLLYLGGWSLGHNKDVWTETSLTLANIKGIADGAFRDCSSLTTVIIPAGAVYSGRDAFEGCTSIADATVPTAVIGSIPKDNLVTVTIDGGTEIPAEAFKDCATLKTVNIKASVTSIGADAFSGCAAIETLKIFDLGKWCEITFVNEGSNPMCNRTADHPVSMSFKDTPITTRLELPVTVTAIGDYAFCNCSELTTVFIPSGVTSVGEHAFEGCDGIEKVTMPVVAIGKISSSDKLREVIINGGTKIPDDAFSGYAVLETVSVPVSVTNIGANAFYGCPIKTAEIPAEFIDAIPHDNLETVTVSGTGASVIAPSALAGIAKLISVTVLPGVGSIGENAFDGCVSLRKVDIKDESGNDSTLKNIEANAFRDCVCLTEIEIPKSVDTISEKAFFGCRSLLALCKASEKPVGWAHAPDPDWNLLDDEGNHVPAVFGWPALKKTEDGKIIDIVNGIRYIMTDGGPGELNTAVVAVQPADLKTEDCAIPEAFDYLGKQYTVTGVSAEAFNGTTWYEEQPDGVISMSGWILGYKKTETTPDLTTLDLTLTENVKGIADRAFRNCATLTSVTIPAAIGYVGTEAFSGCVGITSLTMPASAIGKVTPEKDKLETLVINAGGTIPADAFSGYTALKSVSAAGGITDIGENAFYGCSLLETVDIPDAGITHIGENAFAGTAWLGSKANDVAYLGKWAICYNGDMPAGTAIELLPDDSSTPANEAAVGIADGAFRDRTTLVSITIPKEVRYIGEYAFEGCTGLAAMAIPEHITFIGNGAFMNCTGLEEIVIPSGIDPANIGTDVLTGCNAVKKATIPTKLIADITGLMQSTVQEITINGGTEIPDNAFVGCTALKTVTLGNTVTKIGTGAFAGCGRLETVGIPASVTAIADNTFDGCAALTSVTVPAATTSIGKEAFRGCASLSDITIAGDLTHIGADAFADTAWLGNQPEGVAYLGKWAICYNGVMPGNCDLSIKNGTKGIADGAFREQSDLVSVTMPDSVKIIGANAFENTGLKKVTVPAGIESIGTAAFAGCVVTEATVPVKAVKHIPKNVVTVTLNDAPSEIPADAFNGYSALMTVNPGNAVETVGDRAFKGCSSLESFAMPNSVKTIGASAFENTGLTSITIPAGILSIGANAFKGCVGITSLTMPASAIGKVTPEKDRLETLVINAGGTIPADAFSGYTALKSVSAAGVGITDIGRNAFSGCSLLETVGIPDAGITHIGENAFAGTAWLESKANDVAYLGKWAICYSGVMPENYNLSLNSDAVGIADGAFRDRTALVSITIPKEVKYIGANAFSGCGGLVSIEFKGKMEKWVSIEKGDGWHAGVKASLVTCTDGYVEIDATGNEGQHKFTTGLNYSNGEVNTSNIPGIGGGGLSGMTDTEIVIKPEDDGTPTTKIAKDAFSSKGSVETVYIPGSVDTIGDRAFGPVVKNIYFLGTKAQWDAINGSTVNDNTDWRTGAIGQTLTVHCADGQVITY